MAAIACGGLGLGAAGRLREDRRHVAQDRRFHLQRAAPISGLRIAAAVISAQSWPSFRAILGQSKVVQDLRTQAAIGSVDPLDFRKIAFDLGQIKPHIASTMAAFDGK
jgi:hypothetical protein